MNLLRVGRTERLRNRAARVVFRLRESVASYDSRHVSQRKHRRRFIMKASFAIAGLCGLFACGAPGAAVAESEVKIEEKDGKYSETYQGDDGTKSEYHVDKKEGTSVYKSSDGTSVKEATKDGKFKQEYKDKDCEQSTEKDLVTGDTKVVSKGNCAN
jgi:hypothetical protein